MNILVSNDDGYDAPGIQAVIRMMAQFGTVYVAAPETNHSGASNSLTLRRPLTVQQPLPRHYVINGTPADCVHIALSGLLLIKPDIVVSGINQGQNMAEDTLYSGTVAAAMEGYLKGVPAIAFSQVKQDWSYLDDAMTFAASWLRTHLSHLPSRYLININIPNLPLGEMKGWELTRLGKRHPPQPVQKIATEDGAETYWIGPAGEVNDRSKGTDFCAVEQGLMSVTPLSIDLTDYKAMAQLSTQLTAQLPLDSKA